MKIISTSYINNKYLEISMETVTMSRKEYESLRKMANINIEFLNELINSFQDIKEGRVRRVR